MKSNTFLLPNVIVRRISECRDGNETAVFDEHRPAAHRHRLSYFQLIGLRNAEPMLYPSLFFQRENLTPVQTSQMEAYLQSGSSLLWPELDELKKSFRPMVGNEEENPFEPGEPCSLETQDETAFENDCITEFTGVKPLLNKDAPVAATSRIMDGQEEFLSTSLDSSILVLAPPGTGKTHILIERLCNVIRSLETQNTNESILVLSFTRSAVSVIINRVLDKIKSGADDDLRYLNIRTFDAYATNCLLADHDYESLATKDYDARIEMFNQLLRSESDQFEEAIEQIDRIRYLFVDEIQDLVGDRAEMVLLLTERVLKNGGSVTVLGDPAQAIYDYQVQNSVKLDSRNFLAGLRSLLGKWETSKEIRLTKYWRYTNDELRAFIEEACQALGGDGSEPDGGRFSSLISELDYVNTEDVFNMVGPATRTVVLTRKNAEMHQIARWCELNDLPYKVIDQSTESWPPWVARLLGGFEQDEMSRSKAEQLWEKKIGGNFQAFEAAWSVLVAEGIANDTHADLVAANEIIRKRVPSKERLGDKDGHHCLTISNIHKSKGREYDNVLLLDPEKNWAGDPEETRTIYVAATRARKKLVMLRRNRAIVRSVLHHSSRDFVRISNSLTLLVVNGLKDLDLVSMITSERNREAFRTMQDALWLSHLENNLAARLGMRTAKQQRGMLYLQSEPSNSIVEICKLTSKLSADMLWAKQQSASYNAVTLRGCTSVGLCTYAFDLNSRRVKERFGASGLGLVPLVSGLGEIAHE